MVKKTYIIAEIGNTHEGSLGLAKRFVDAAAECGVDCVKFQTHIFDAESLPTAPNPHYFKDETRKQYFDRTSFTKNEWNKLKKYCEKKGLDFISSVFSLEAVDLLEELNVIAHKIPSGEVTNIPLLEKVAKTGKKVYLSSGMSSWKELDLAVKTLRKNGCNNLCVLQCASRYPCPPEKAGLNLIKLMKSRYQTQIGYSDHTIGATIPLAAVFEGAEVIEKHFTLSKKMYGSDAKNATEPEEFKILVDMVRQYELAINSSLDKDKEVRELGEMKVTFEKSIVYSKALEKGHKISEVDLCYKKPGDGISAAEYKSVLGKTLKKDVLINQVFKWSDVK